MDYALYRHDITVVETYFVMLCTSKMKSAIPVVACWYCSHENRPTEQISSPRWALPTYGSSTNYVVPGNPVLCGSDYMILTAAGKGVVPYVCQ